MQHFIPNTALVCEGGGMRAVYTGGMASVMLEEGIKFPYVTGVSAGTTIAVNYVMQNIERMHDGFIDLSSDPDNVGIKPLLRGEGYFNSFSIYEEAFYEEEDMDANWRAFHDSGVEVALSAFDQDTGEIRYWHQADISSYRDLMRICRASSSLPMMMPTTYIDGVGYVDGGVRECFVIQPAIDAGIERFVILPTHKRGYRRETSTSEKLAKYFYREHRKVAEALKIRAERYNIQMELIEKMEADGRALVLYPETMPVSRTDHEREILETTWALGREQAKNHMEAWLDWMHHA